MTVSSSLSLFHHLILGGSLCAWTVRDVDCEIMNGEEAVIERAFWILKEYVKLETIGLKKVVTVFLLRIDDTSLQYI